MIFPCNDGCKDLNFPTIVDNSFVSVATVESSVFLGNTLRYTHPLKDP